MRGRRPILSPYTSPLVGHPAAPCDATGRGGRTDAERPCGWVLEACRLVSAPSVHALQRPHTRPAWRADAGRTANGVGRGLGRARLAWRACRPACSSGGPARLQPAAGDRYTTTTTRHLSYVCGGANAGAWGGGGAPPPHAGRLDWRPLPPARPPGGVRHPPDLTRSPVVAVARRSIPAGWRYVELSRSRRWRASRSMAAHWAAATCAGQAIPPVGPPARRVSGGVDLPLAACGGGSRRWGGASTGPIRPAGPRTRPSGVLRWPGRPPANHDRQLALPRSVRARAASTPPGGGLACCGPRPRAGSGMGRQRRLLSPCQGGRGAWARQRCPAAAAAAATGVAKVGPCPLDPFPVAAWAAHAARRVAATGRLPLAVCRRRGQGGGGTERRAASRRGGFPPRVARPPPPFQRGYAAPRAVASRPPRRGPASRAR